MKPAHALIALVACHLLCTSPLLAAPIGMAKLVAPGAPAKTPLQSTVSNPWYHGGYLIGEPEVHALFWGPNVRFAPQLSQYYADMGNSGFFDILGEYAIAGYSFSRTGMPSGYIWDEAPGNTYLTDGDIEAALSSLLNAGTIHATPNAVFMIHFPPGVTIEMGGGTSCQVWCAYHGRYWWNNTMIYYGVVPDHSGNCSWGCGGGAQTPDEFSRTCVSVSHEVVETMTDPEGTGWFDNEGEEISDICNGQPTQLGGWWVQKQWSNAQNACVGP